MNKFRKAGYKLFEIVLTDGSGGYSSKDDRDKIVEIREKEFESAAKLLQLKKFFYLKYDEHTLVMDRKNVEMLTKIIREVKPQIVIIPGSEDYHETHIETNKISTKALRTAMKKRKLELGNPVDVFSVIEWEYSVMKQPDVIVDISDEWDLKEKLLGCYKSQITQSERQKLQSLNMYRGSMIGVEKAEAFRINKFIPTRLDKFLFS